MISLSVVIITFNEEKNIELCINSVKNIADEIVVVDSFSTDNTKEICLKHNVKFIQHKFEGYIKQKNFAITQASSEHILSIDADESISPELEESIIKVKNNWKADGYYFNRLTNYCGKWIRHCGWYPDKKLRLFDKSKGSWVGTDPHDRFEIDKNSTTIYLKGDLLHFSYYSIYQHIAQTNKFSEIGAIEDFKNGRSISFLGLILKPLWKFIRDFIFKAGFLDGYYGFVICKISANATFLKCLKIRELKKKSFK